MANEYNSDLDIDDSDFSDTLSQCSFISNDDDNSMCGYLWKSSGRERNKAKGFQKRWFVLSSSGLSYYKSKKDTKPLKDEIPLCNIQNFSEADQITKKDNSFQIITGDRIFYLVARNDNERSVWLECLSHITNSSQGIKDIELNPDINSLSTNSSPTDNNTIKQNIIKIGYLYKKGGKKKEIAIWQKRWVIIIGSTILYYRKVSDQKPAGCISLHDITSILPDADVVTEKEYSFSISTVTRDYFFYTNSAQHRINSIQLIQSNIPENLLSSSSSLNSQIIPLNVSLRDNFDNNNSNINDINQIDSFNDSDFDVPSCDKQGFLWKTPGNKKKPGGWQKRWFILTNNFLYYYKQKNDSKEAGSFDLSEVLDAKVIPSDNQFGFRFDVHTEKRIYHLYAENEVDCKEWIRLLTRGKTSELQSNIYDCM